MPTLSDIKKAQKESLLQQEISKLFLEICKDNPEIKDLFITHVKLSKDKGVCYVYFYTNLGKQVFDEYLDILKLYKPSIRKSLANLKFRYAPELVFMYDNLFEKQMRIEGLIEKVKSESDKEEN